MRVWSDGPIGDALPPTWWVVAVVLVAWLVVLGGQ